jgi:protein O-mannosyl-transferase
MPRSARALLLPTLLGALLLSAGIYAWSKGTTGPYLFDDYVTPLDDPASQSLTAWADHVSVTLRPLTKLTYAAEADTHIADSPTARRVVSISLLAASAALLMALISRLVPNVAPYGSMLFAAIWFVHPVHADAVLLLSGRSAILSIVFVMGALLAMERGRAWYAALFFVFACLSRETALAAVLPLGVLAATQRGTSHRALAPILLGAALMVAWIVTTRRYVALAEYSMFGRPFRDSFVAQVAAVPLGLSLLIRPAQLSIDYGVPLPIRFDAPLFLLGLALYAGAAAGIALLASRSRASAVGLAVWLAALLPTQSFVPKLDALTNRPLSLALAGLLLATAPAVAALLRRSRDMMNPLASKAIACCGVALFVALAAAAVHRAELFRSDLDLWADAARKSTTNVRPHLQYAVLLKRAGRDRAALNVVTAARRIDPLNSQAATMVRLFRTGDISQ